MIDGPREENINAWNTAKGGWTERLWGRRKRRIKEVMQEQARGGRTEDGEKQGMERGRRGEEEGIEDEEGNKEWRNRLLENYRGRNK